MQSNRRDLFLLSSSISHFATWLFSRSIKQVTHSLRVKCVVREQATKRSWFETDNSFFVSRDENSSCFVRSSTTAKWNNSCSTSRCFIDLLFVRRTRAHSTESLFDCLDHENNCWMIEPHGWWRTAYHAPRKHLVRMARVVRWRGSTVHTLSAGRLDDGSHSGLNSSSDDQLRIELDLHAMTSNRDHCLDHHFNHHLRPERNQQTRSQDDWADDVEAVWRRWDQVTKLEDELDWWRSHWVNKSIISSRWVDHPECMRRLSRLYESKNNYIERPKFPHLVDRQRKKFSLYEST